MAKKKKRERENETANRSEEITANSFRKQMKDIILKIQGGRALSPLLSMGQVLYQPLLPSVLAGKGEIPLMLVPVSAASPDSLMNSVLWDFPQNITWMAFQPHMDSTMPTSTVIFIPSFSICHAIQIF